MLVVSPDYLNSAACRHEMARAIAGDPGFQHGRVIPVVRVSCDLPEEIRRPNPLYVNLTDDRDCFASARDCFCSVVRRRLHGA